MEASLGYNSGHGIEVLILVEHDGHRRWKPVRNFGDRQGDAILYRDTIRHDRWKYEHLMSLAKNYSPDVIITHLDWRVGRDGYYVPAMKVREICNEIKQSNQ